MSLERDLAAHRGVEQMTAPGEPADRGWQDIESRMQREQVPELAIRIFHSHYQQLLQGKDGYLREAEMLPVEELPHLDSMPDGLAETGRDAISQTVMLKLNGGLGTSMGLDGPKSLLRVRDQRTFLDFIIAQAQSRGLPLLLMNSFATSAATAQALEARHAVDPERVIPFEQHRVPKILADNYAAAQFDARPDLAWCPPGHGDLYASLVTSGTLAWLLQRNYRFMFASNADNLGAVLDLRLLGYLAQKQIPFLMEVAGRTAVDRKGGHLARGRDGTFLLREIAQCHRDEQDAFQDVDRHRFFNTNNLWIDLPALAQALERYAGAFPLPLIVNRKTLDPCDPSSPAVVQLETAMGAAISLLPNAEAVCVPRSRFSPVKTLSDLVVARSDAYEVDEQGSIRLIPERAGTPPVLKMDHAFYQRVGDVDERLPNCPSLKRCRSLTISGSIRIPADAVFVGDVELVNGLDETVCLDGGEITGKHVLGRRHAERRGSAMAAR